MPKKQSYICMKCGYEGTVYFTASDNVVSMCIKVAENHNINSPGCKDWEGQLRIKDWEGQLRIKDQWVSE